MVPFDKSNNQQVVFRFDQACTRLQERIITLQERNTILSERLLSRVAKSRAILDKHRISG